MPLDANPSRSAQVGNEIRAWRTARGLSQRGAADALHVPRASLQGWENGRPCQCAGLLRAYMLLADKYEPTSVRLDL